jgi:hypothetical protein
MPSSYQVVLWKQESFAVLRPLQIEFFRNLLGVNTEGTLYDKAKRQFPIPSMTSKTMRSTT